MVNTLPRSLFALMVLCSVALQAQMIDPAIDRADEPFCYFSKPTDVIGVMDGKEATLVSPEGFLYTGWGEMMFFTGNPAVPINQRVKTLLRGYLPVIQYQFDERGIRYAFTAFAATLDGNPEHPLMNFVRVNILNREKVRRTAYFSVGLRYQGEANTDWGVADHRFGRPVSANIPGEFEQAGTAFSRDWLYRFAEDALIRNDSLMYLFPTMPAPVRTMTRGTGYNERQSPSPTTLYVDPTTPVGLVNYALTLAPGEERTLEFKMPYEPVPENSSYATQLRTALFDDYLNRTISFWEGILERGIQISMPEQKVVDAFKANLIYDLIARNKVDSFYIQKVNEFQYDSFWIRDAAFILRMYDLSGYHEFARQCLEFFARWQRPDGNFVSHGGQFDGWGQTLWAYGQHFRIARDTAFARTVYPSVLRAFAWLQCARAGDSLHVMPVTTPGDNEDITGHVTGHTFWALIGLKNAAVLAEGLGYPEDAKRFKAEYDDLHATVMTLLRTNAKTTNGYIPPGLENSGGNDWDNMSALYPELLLDPFDPMVTGTLNATRGKYQEGIMTYGNGRWLHHYLTATNTQSELIRGEQRLAVEDVYAMLVHTSATHAGFEFAILPWSTRDFMMNLSPHGWFSAQFRAVIRNMFVREQGSDLHLFSAVSPEWLKEGETIAVHQAPTDFGRVDLDLTVRKDGATLTIVNGFVNQPRSLVLHLPWFLNVRSVRADGQNIRPVAGAVTLPAATQRVELSWTKRTDAPEMNYVRSVDEFKAEYRRRYEEFLSNGKQVY